MNHGDLFDTEKTFAVADDGKTVLPIGCRHVIRRQCRQTSVFKGGKRVGQVRVVVGPQSMSMSVDDTATEPFKMPFGRIPRPTGNELSVREEQMADPIRAVDGLKTNAQRIEIKKFFQRE